MNQYFLENIILAEYYKTLWSIICERVTSINIFFIFGYVRNLSQKRDLVNGYEHQMGGRNTHNS